MEITIGYNGPDFPSAESLRPYMGQWIAYKGTAIIGSGKDAAEVLRAARDEGYNDVPIFLVPSQAYA